MERLEIDKVAAPQSFLWLWCGSSDGLDAARRVCNLDLACRGDIGDYTVTMKF